MSRRGRRGNGRDKSQVQGQNGAGADHEDTDNIDDIVVTDEDGNPIDGQDDDVEVVHAEREVKDQGADGDEAFEALQRQFEAEKVARAAADAKNRDHESRHAVQAQDQVVIQRTLLDHSILTAQSELKAAKAAFREAMTAQDFEAAGEAQAAIAAAQLDARNYELSRDYLDTQIEQAKKAPKPAANVEEQIETTIRSLSPKSQDWARKNKADLFASEARFNRAYAAHLLAVSDGITPDTDDYFTFLDKQMGYGGDKPVTKQTQERRPPIASAPPNRGGSAGGNQVQLSQAERDMATRMGMTFSKYAKYKKQLLDNGADPNWAGPRLSQFDGQRKG